MLTVSEIRSKILKIEALMKGASTEGERKAARTALKNHKKLLSDVLENLKNQEKSRKLNYTVIMKSDEKLEILSNICKKYQIAFMKAYQKKGVKITIIGINKADFDILMNKTDEAYEIFKSVSKKLDIKIDEIQKKLLEAFKERWDLLKKVVNDPSFKKKDIKEKAKKIFGDEEETFEEEFVDFI